MELFWQTIADYNTMTWPVQALIVLAAVVLTARLYLRPTRNAEGRQFFNESYWRLYTKKYSHSDQLNFSWVFNILPEDIALL